MDTKVKKLKNILETTEIWVHAIEKKFNFSCSSLSKIHEIMTTQKINGVLD
jgi:hypothetical protein